MDADIFFQIQAMAVVWSISVVTLSAMVQTLEKEKVFVTGVKKNTKKTKH